MNEILKKIVDLKKEGWTYRQIGDELGLSKDCVRSKYRRYIDKLKPEEKDSVHDKTQFTKEEKDNVCTISTKSTKIRTVEDALKYAEIDTDIWEVDTVTINSWEIPRKDIKKDIKYNDDKKTGYEKDSGEFNNTTMWQVKVKLKRKIEYPVLSALNTIINELKNNPPNINSVSHTKKSNPHLMEISLVDHHFGKMCVDGSGMVNAKNLYINAVDNLLNKTKGIEVDKVIFPLGSDFFHIDNKENKTARGTPQDVDGHITDIFKQGCSAVVESLYKIREIAPIKVIYIPGNHDYMTSFYLCEFIKAWFNDHNDIEVDTDKLPRKYEFYGKNLIGYTHGKEEKVNDLARLIMSENLNDSRISEVEYIEFHKGHWHKKKELQYTSGDTVGNVRIVELPSLSGTDFWHFSKGFVGAKRAAEAHLYNYEYGNIGNFVCDVREIM